MINFFYNLNCYEQALLASIGTFLITCLGASTVFFFRKVNKLCMKIMVSLSSGIMFSAAIFSLLIPAMEQANNLHLPVSMVLTMSILLGSLLLIIGDRLSLLLIPGNSKFKSIFLLVISICLHNIPEGLAIGMAFGSVMYNLEGVTVASALSLSIGIGIQNFPEGVSIAIPVRQLGITRFKAFVIGSASAIVEPIAAIIGVLTVLKVKFILPYLLAFASGAMIFIVVEELIPEALNTNKKNLMTYLVLVGFVIMMILEIGL